MAGGDHPRGMGDRWQSCRQWVGKRGCLQCRTQPTVTLHDK